MWRSMPLTHVRMPVELISAMFKQDQEPHLALVADLGRQHGVLVGVVQRLDNVLQPVAFLLAELLEVPPAEELHQQPCNQQSARHTVVDLDLERKPNGPGAPELRHRGSCGLHCGGWDPAVPSRSRLEPGWTDSKSLSTKPLGLMPTGAPSRRALAV